MEIRLDFMNCLHHDISMKILMCLEDPSDLVRASAVSRSWRHFVIANGLCKQLCLRMFPRLHQADCVVEPNGGIKKPSEVGCSKFVEWENLEREHRAYAFLAHGCSSFSLRSCISDAISASSTDHYPRESIRNTLVSRDRVARRSSYWSSKGQSNPAVPETLLYKLVADICIISEIYIQPFEAYFQEGLPIYSARSVRFRMGHPIAPLDDSMGEPSADSVDDKFMWTYTSPEFPMTQENQLQEFKLPEPVLCIGGILQVELLGRVQIQAMDGLFYICVSHVQVMGRSLSPAFGVEILEPSGKFVLKAESYACPIEEPCAIQSGYLHGPVRDWELILNMLQGQEVDILEPDWNEEDDESDDEYFL